MALGVKTDFDCIDKVLKPVKRIERKGLQDLLYEDEKKRIELWNKLEEERDFYEDNDSCGADSGLHKDIESRFALTRLKLATSFNENGTFPNITKRFNETELGLFKIIEEFRFFDDYTIEEIKDRIGRKEGKVYEMVKDYSTKMESDRDHIFENPEIKPGIALAIKNLLKERTDKIQEAVIEYIRLNGIVITTKEMESAIQKVIESEQKRGQISDEVQEKLDRLEDDLDEARQAASMKGELENKLIEMEKQVMQKDFEKDILDNKLQMLENDKSSLGERYSALDYVLQNRINEVEDKRKELEAKENEIRELGNNLQTDLKAENNKIIQEELEKIRQMKNDIQSQVAGIENEKNSLKFQKAEIDEKFNEMKKAIEGNDSSNRFVPKDLAKLYEMDHIGRFDMKMHELPLNVTNPINGKTYKVKSWDGSHSKTDEKDKIYDMFKNEISISEVETQIPLNVRSIYVIGVRRFKLFGKKEPKTIIESMVFNHWKEYAKNGFDTKPVILSELNSILVHLINNAEMGKYFHVIAIASPTGWDERIRTYIESDEFNKNFVSRYISICLVDNETGEMIYNKADERIKEYINLFEPEFDSEKVSKCKQYIIVEHEFDDHLVLDDIIKETGLEMRLVKKTFRELESEGYGNVKFIKTVGIVLKK